MCVVDALQAKLLSTVTPEIAFPSSMRCITPFTNIGGGNPFFFFSSSDSWMNFIMIRVDLICNIRFVYSK